MADKERRGDKERRSTKRVAGESDDRRSVDPAAEKYQAGPIIAKPGTKRSPIDREPKRSPLGRVVGQPAAEEKPAEEKPAAEESGEEESAEEESAEEESSSETEAGMSAAAKGEAQPKTGGGKPGDKDKAEKGQDGKEEAEKGQDGKEEAEKGQDGKKEAEKGQDGKEETANGQDGTKAAGKEKDGEEMSVSEPPGRGPVGVYVAAAVVVVAVILFVFMVADKPDQDTSVAAPTVGGPFELVDTNGYTVTDANYRGRFMLVYFGYTFCPDICPVSLTTMADTLDMLDRDGDNIVPIFITVDPDRDSPEGLAEYLKFFHPRQVALTGTPSQVEAVVKAYRGFAAKVREDGAELDDYLMDHTSAIYLMGPDGQFRAYFSYGTSAGEMAEQIRNYL